VGVACGAARRGQQGRGVPVLKNNRLRVTTCRLATLRALLATGLIDVHGYLTDAGIDVRDARRA